MYRTNTAVAELRFLDRSMAGTGSGHAMAEDDAAAAGLERKLATILSADVAAYSRLMAEDEERTLQTFRGHKEVFENWWSCIAAGSSIPPVTLSSPNSAAPSKRCVAPPRSQPRFARATAAHGAHPRRWPGHRRRAAVHPTETDARRSANDANGARRPLPPPRPSARYRSSERTFAGPHGNGQDAAIPVVLGRRSSGSYRPDPAILQI